MNKVTARVFETGIACRVVIGALGLFLATAAHSQTTSVNAADWIGFDLASERTGDEPLPTNDRWRNLTPLGIGQSTTGVQHDNGVPVSIAPSTSRSMNAHEQARSLTGTTSSGIIEFDDETVSQLDIQLGGRNGLNLTSSFGVTSQPRDANPSDIFFLRGNQVREDRAVARIGVRF